MKTNLLIAILVACSSLLSAQNKAMFSYTVGDNNRLAPLSVVFHNESVLEEGDSIVFSWFINSYNDTLSNDTNFSYVFEKP